MFIVSERLVLAKAWSNCLYPYARINFQNRFAHCKLVCSKPNWYKYHKCVERHVCLVLASRLLRQSECKEFFIFYFVCLRKEGKCGEKCVALSPPAWLLIALNKSHRQPLPKSNRKMLPDSPQLAVKEARLK